jgi:predicted DNA-binding antitoxin AbrB/MazE fold protein
LTGLKIKKKLIIFFKISWYKDSHPLPASTRYTTNYDLNTGVVSLRISDAFMNDVGTYTAVAENEAGQDTTSCQAAIKQMPNIDTTPMVNPDAFKYLEQPQPQSARNKGNDAPQMQPPRVLIPLSNVQLEEGQSVMLACKIDGAPRPKITWFKDSVLLPAASRYTTTYDLNSNVATLKIDNAQMNDLGTYIALAENPAGRDQTICSLFVQEIPGIDQRPLVNPDAFKYLENPQNRYAAPDKEDEGGAAQPPVVIVPLQDLTLKEGEPVLLICKIEGNPKPKVQCLFNFFLIRSSTPAHHTSYQN